MTTTPERVLLAAARLTDQGQERFSAEDLVVHAWQAFPRELGLAGFEEQYPDSNKVLSCIMGGRGLVARGWLERTGPKQYTLTPQGREIAARLLGHSEPRNGKAAVVEVPLPTLANLPPPQERALRRFLDSSVADKFLRGSEHELTFRDACIFWGITDGTVGSSVDFRLAATKARLAILDRHLADGSVRLGDRRIVRREDVQNLLAAHTHLLEQFNRHLALLANRRPAVAIREEAR